MTPCCTLALSITLALSQREREQMSENKTARREGGLLLWTYVRISAYLRLRLHHPDKELLTFSGEVGFGRRLRGNAYG